MKKIIGIDGADVTFEAVGSNEAIASAIESTGALGSIVLVGNPSTDLILPKNIYWSILRKQITEFLLKFTNSRLFNRQM